MEAFKLKKSFLMGCATAATQIEGGDTNNSWYDWSEQRRIKDGSTSLRADDHYRLYREDARLMQDMGLEIYRMGLEFSRIEPQRGVFDSKAIEHYKDEMRLLNEKGIRVLVTLHHFANPMWFEHMGAFENSESVQIFTQYVEHVVEQFGDLCCEYVTINEPNVYAVNGFTFGEWPPAKKSVAATFKVMKNMAKAHLAAYETIHRVRKEHGFAGRTMVGFANHYRVFVPYRSRNLIDKAVAKLFDLAFQGAITDAMAWGKFSFPLGLFSRKKGDFCDYFGINYYTRSAMRGFENTFLPDRPVNDLGWELYPEGITLLSERFYKRYGKPVWITENGTCDSEDAFRTQYLYDHLKALSQTSAPVERYYHWTLMDNFEWLEGESARFGLVKVDYETQERTVRPSGRFFSEVIKNEGVTEEMCRAYFGESGTVQNRESVV